MENFTYTRHREGRKAVGNQLITYLTSLWKYFSEPKQRVVAKSYKEQEHSESHNRSRPRGNSTKNKFTLWPNEDKIYSVLLIYKTISIDISEIW